MKRFLWFFFGTVALFVMVAVVIALRQPAQRPSAPVKLTNGETIRIVAVTYGTNHVVGNALTRFVSRMPPKPQAILRRVLGSRAVPEGSTRTSEPKLVVWLRESTNNASAAPRRGYMSAFLSDTNGFISGESAEGFHWRTSLQDFQFRVFPRRDSLITLNLYYHSATGGVTRCASLPFANPFRGRFVEWQAEPLPATHRAGDVAVTLEKLSTGHDESTRYRGKRGGRTIIEFGTNRTDGRNNTVCVLKIASLTNTNEVWRVANEEVSDATGNKIGNSSMGWGGYGDGYFTFAPALWPSEPAWKLRCEIKRAEGFDKSETFVFEDAPLGRLDQTNQIGWTTNFGGVTVTLDQILRRAPNTNDSWSAKDCSDMQFTTAGLTNGLRLDLLSAITDAGTKLKSGSWSSGGDRRNYSYRDIPLDARTVSFTFAVQHSRWVEFTVKPEVGPLSLERERKPGG